MGKILTREEFDQAVHYATDADRYSDQGLREHDKALRELVEELTNAHANMCDEFYCSPITPLVLRAREALK